MSDLLSLKTYVASELNRNIKNIELYLSNTTQRTVLSFEEQLNITILTTKYTEIVQDYSNLLNLLTDAQYFISRCRKALGSMSDNTSEEINCKAKIKSAMNLIEGYLPPLEVEKERIKTLEMFYRNLYSRKDF